MIDMARFGIRATMAHVPICYVVAMRPTIIPVSMILFVVWCPLLELVTRLLLSIVLLLLHIVLLLVVLSTSSATATTTITATASATSLLRWARVGSWILWCRCRRISIVVVGVRCRRVVHWRRCLWWDWGWCRSWWARLDCKCQAVKTGLESLEGRGDVVEQFVVGRRHGVESRGVVLIYISKLAEALGVLSVEVIVGHFSGGRWHCS
jgi:hypothetical protein